MVTHHNPLYLLDRRVKVTSDVLFHQVAYESGYNVDEVKKQKASEPKKLTVSIEQRKKMSDAGSLKE